MLDYSWFGEEILLLGDISFFYKIFFLAMVINKIKIICDIIKLG